MNNTNHFQMSVNRHDNELHLHRKLWSSSSRALMYYTRLLCSLKLRHRERRYSTTCRHYSFLHYLTDLVSSMALKYLAIQTKRGKKK